MKQPTIYNTALYCRLSKDDGLEQDSSSIQTQKEMLTRYCRENGFIISGIYVDDGWSGTNTNRPEFQRMLSDIENGKINCVITKDLSRLGRNYLDTGAYTEVYFPEHGVRYIAVTDGVDTLHASTMDITPFRNLLNDMYAKDVSKKVKSAILTRQKQGKFVGMKAPYGYKKDPNDKNHLVIDERYAPIVRQIFDMAQSGMGVVAISKTLCEKKIPRPVYAAAEVVSGYDRYMEDESRMYDWRHEVVRNILRNPVYAGHIRGQHRPKVSIKSGKRVNNGSAGLFIIENCHEPIVPPDEWELVQRLITSRRKVLADNEVSYDNIFSGLVKCADCGYSMTTHVDRRIQRDNIIDKTKYMCNTYRAKGTPFCSGHYINARDLYETVLADIKRIARLAMDSDDKFIDFIISNHRKNETTKTAQSEKDLKKYSRRLAELDDIFAKLYEDRVSGSVTERNYATLSAKYEQEQIELEEKIAFLSAEVKESKAANQNAETFAEMIKEYADITELSAAMLNTLIDKILIHETEVVDGEPVQRIEIYYKFVGILE